MCQAGPGSVPRQSRCCLLTRPGVRGALSDGVSCKSCCLKTEIQIGIFLHCDLWDQSPPNYGIHLSLSVTLVFN